MWRLLCVCLTKPDTEEVDGSNPFGPAIYQAGDLRFPFQFRFPNFYFWPGGFGGSAGPDGVDEVGAAGFSGASWAGNFSASFTMVPARSLLLLHPGS